MTYYTVIAVAAIISGSVYGVTRSTNDVYTIVY